MKAHVVFINKYQPRIVMQAADSYVVVQSRSRAAIGPTDEISGDLTLHNVKWLLNLTRSMLINIKVLGRFSSLDTALEAAMVIEPAAPFAVPANLVRHMHRHPPHDDVRSESSAQPGGRRRNTVPDLRDSAAESPSYLARNGRRPRQEAVSR